MTAHRCTELTDGCYRCDLNRDEIQGAIDEAHSEAQAAWLEYRNRYAMTHGTSPRRTARQLRRRDFIAGYLAAEGIGTTN